MSLSEFLGRYMGIILLIISLAMLCKRECFEKAVEDVGKNDALMTILSILPLLFGLAIVLGHNVWNSWAVVITLIGWILALIGSVRLFFHEELMERLLEITKHPFRIPAIGAVLLIIGLYLTIFGFWV